jgi:hypothetical protein
MSYEPDQESIQPDSPDLAEPAIGSLKGKWGGERACPYCGEADWGVTGPFRIVRHTTAGQPTTGLEPHYQAICHGCGNTVFINSRFIQT